MMQHAFLFSFNISLLERVTSYWIYILHFTSGVIGEILCFVVLSSKSLKNCFRKHEKIFSPKFRLSRN